MKIELFIAANKHPMISRWDRCKPFAWKSKGRAFTLIEILAVIAIVLVLASILFPMIQKTQESARFAASIANMRQIAAGIAGYAGDNNGDRPFYYGIAGGTSPLTKISWTYQGLGLVAPYMGAEFNNAHSLRPFLDPADITNKRFYAPQTPWSAWSVAVTSYPLRGGQATQGSTEELTTKLMSWSGRALVSSYFLYNSADPQKNPLTWHPGRFAVLYGNGSISTLPIPDFVDTENPPPFAASVTEQNKMWDWFDEQFRSRRP